MQESSLIQRLRNQCARREYARSDIRRKAMTALGDPDAAERVVSSLVAENYVNDARYAAAYAREKASIYGWGARKIRQMLSAKGISREDIDSGLQEVDPVGALSRMRKVMAVKYASLKDDPQCRSKMLRFALGRGYGYEEAYAEVRRLAGGDPDE